MPERTPRTKAERAAAVHQVMHEFKEGDLHSGSKQGPQVKSRKQAVAIAMSESGQSNQGSKHVKQPHPKTNPGSYDTEAHSAGAHRGGSATGQKGDIPLIQGTQTGAEGASRPPVANMTKGQDMATGGERHVFGGSRSGSGAHGFGHPATCRSGPLRTSGHSGAHRIGKRK